MLHQQLARLEEVQEEYKNVVLKTDDKTETCDQRDGTIIVSIAEKENIKMPKIRYLPLNSTFQFF